MTTAQQPPAIPIHQTPLPSIDISTTTMPTKATTSTKMRHSYLGQQQQQHYESSSEESDEEEGDTFSNRFSSESVSENVVTEEHKFWQVHASTTIIAPPSIDCRDDVVDMTYVNPRLLKKKTQPRPKISLALHVKNILGSVINDVDIEIEQEWENNRTQLKKSLIVLPTLSLS